MKKVIKYISVSVVVLSIITTILVFLYLQNTPQQIVQKFCNSLQKNDFEVAYDCISSDDKKELSYTDFLKKYHFDELTKKGILARSEFKDYKTIETEDKIKVTVSVTSPDVSKVLLSFMPLIMSKALNGKNDNDTEIQNKVAQKIEEGNLPFVTTEESFDVIKEDGKWKIFFNVRQNNQVDKLKEEAKQYEKENKLNKAKENYEEILKLQGNSVEVESKINDIDEKINLFEEKQSYIKNITLKDVKVFDYDDWTDKGKAFKGVIINEGDKTLKEVQLTVYMYDKEDNIIAEENFYPVAFSYVDNKPFKPKYVRDFGWKLTKYAPTGWSGKIKVEITDIKFQ